MSRTEWERRLRANHHPGCTCVECTKRRLQSHVPAEMDEFIQDHKEPSSKPPPKAAPTPTAATSARAPSSEDTISSKPVVKRSPQPIVSPLQVPIIPRRRPGRYPILKFTGHALRWTLLLAIGGVLCLLLYPFFPATLRGWVSSGQDRVQSIIHHDGASGGLLGGVSTPTARATSQPTRIVVIQAEQVVKSFVAAMNAYDENKLEGLTTPRVFADLRPDVLWGESGAFEIHVLQYVTPQACNEMNCHIEVKGKVSGIFGTSDYNKTFIISPYEGRLVVYDMYDTR